MTKDEQVEKPQRGRFLPGAWSRHPFMFVEEELGHSQLCIMIYELLWGNYLGQAVAASVACFRKSLLRGGLEWLLVNAKGFCPGLAMLPDCDR